MSAPQSTETALWLSVQVFIVGWLGSRRLTVSPLAQVRLTVAKVGPPETATAEPLTDSCGAEHQPGMRTESGKAVGAPSATVNVTVSLNG